MNKIEINLQTNIDFSLKGMDKLTVPYLRRQIESIFRALDIKNKKVSLLFCDNQFIQQLNHYYRHKDYPTDVLSFESDSNTFLGDIAISLEKAQEQSVQYQVSFHDELQRLLIHGILHLLGYDHERSSKDEKIMMLLEEKIFLEVKSSVVC